MVQSSDHCINASSENFLGHLDVNYSTVDYSRNSEVSEDNALEEKKFIRFPKTSQALPIAGIVALAGIGYGIKRKYVNKKYYI